MRSLSVVRCLASLVTVLGKNRLSLISLIILHYVIGVVGISVLPLAGVAFFSNDGLPWLL